MAERKVMNFYISPDFDPSKVPKGKRESRIEATMMLPFSIQCMICGEFMARGKKFNSKVRGVVWWRDYALAAVQIPAANVSFLL
jgi:hypothetical protein